MSGFDDVVRAAALGARNRPLTEASLSAPVAAVLSGADGAERVLEAAAAHAAAARTAIPAAPATALNLPARPAPVIDPGLADILTRIMALDHPQDEFIVRVLRLVRRRGLRLPPPLLNRVASALSGDDRDEVVAVMDERDRAVFALDERWAARIRRFAQRNAPPDPARWEDGDAQERADHLARLRRTDPDAARALLADGAWLRARAPEREQILNALAIGLGPADEQILEERLDDRAEAVRGRAAELLSRLPSSALIARAEALAERHVVVTRRALRAPAVELHGIEMTDALARDRYPAKAHRTSASLARLEEVIARIPTWRWPDLVGISAAELARARVRCDGQKADLIAPLVRAAVAWRDGELAAALADLGRSPAPAGLFGLLDEPRREALLHRLIAAKRYSAVVTCTLSWPSELTAEQSRIFARSLIAVTRPGSYISDSRWWGVLPARCAPDALDEVLAILRGAPPDTLSDLRAQTVITALELRRELLELTDRTDQEAS